MGTKGIDMNIAILGLRGHHVIILDGLLKLPDVRLTAVAEDDQSLCEAVRRHPAVGRDVRFYADYRELLSREDVQIAGVCGTDGVRAEAACACAARGIHMITEKPLAIDLPGLDRVRNAVQQAGVRLTMMISMRYAPQFIAMRQAVAAGLVGEVCQLSAQKSYRLGERPAWMKSRKTFSGIIPFIGIHALDLMRWTSGREYVRVMASQANVCHPNMGELDDSASLLLTLDNGGSATARLDYCRPAAAASHGDDRVRIAGNKGVIEVIFDEVRLTTHDCPERVLPLGLEENHFADFVRALKTGGECLVPAADCFRMTEIVLLARTSAETGEAVAVGAR